MKKITIIEPAEARAITAKTRVAAYCRVSTGMDDQLVSLETQKSHYENLIGSNPEWEYAGLYYDEGISGTSKEKRPALMRMVADCEAGKIDRIMTKFCPQHDGLLGTGPEAPRPGDHDLL